MPNSQENLKEKFFERYYQLKQSELMLIDSINLLNSINPDVEGKSDCTIEFEEFISKISEYKAYAEDVEAVNRIFQQVSTNEIEFIVALAELNHLHDMACSKAQNMLLINDIFKCYF